MDPIQSWVDPDEVRRLAEGLITRPPKPDEARDEAGYGEEWVGFAGNDRQKRSSQPPAPPAETAPEATAPPAVPQEAVPEVDVRVQYQARQSLATARRIADQSGILSASAPPAEAPSAPAPTQAAAPSPSPDTPPAPALATPSPAQAAAPAPATPQAVSPAPAGPAPSPFVARLQRYGGWLHQSFRAKGFFVTNRDGEVLIDEVRSPKLLQVARTLAHASRTANRQAGGVAVGSLHIKLGPDGILEVIPLTSRYGPLVLGLIVPESLPPQGVRAAAAGLQQVVDGTRPNP